MTITNGYCTLAEIKDNKRISSTSSPDDGVIEALVEAASRYIDDLTGRRFHTTAADETRYFESDNSTELFPGNIISITSLKTDADGDRTYETTWATTDYDLLPANAALDGLPYHYIRKSPAGANSFPTHSKGVQIVGKFGYSAAPKPIKQACIMIVTSLYLSRFGNNTEGAATITGAGVVITPKDIPAGALELIRPHIDTGMLP